MMKRTIDLSEVENNEMPLTADERRDRIELLNLMIDERGSLPVSKCDDIETFNSLVEKGKVVLNEEKTAVDFLYPVSGLPTAHRIKLSDGREFTSMCAIDSLGSTFTFWQDLEIHSVCATSGEEIFIKIENGQITERSSPEIHAIHVDLNAFDDWSDSC